MRRANPIFPIALAGSLALHVIGIDLYAHYGAHFGMALPRVAQAHRAPELIVSVDPDLMNFGEATGSGIGVNKTEGDQPQLAREADENQANLDRRPTGNGDTGNSNQIANPGSPASTPLAKTDPSQSMQSPPQAMQLPDPVVATNTQPMPTPMTPPADAQPNPPIATDDVATKPNIRIEATTRPIVALQPALPAPTPATSVDQTASAARSKPGAPSAAGVPVPHSDSDSDPFSRLNGSVVYRNGKLDVQLGRQVHTVRPQLGVGGISDAWTIASASLTVEAHIDAQGRVTQVELPKKTGSNAIDEPTRNAVYQWTFEPTHDKQGHAIADVLFFEIDYR